MPELLLLRHGLAEDRGGGCPDAERALTPLGVERTRQVVRRLVALDLGCERLLSSPLRRARQTAELAVSAGLASALELTEALAPGGDPLPLLQQALGPGRLALVGHEPDLGDLAARLIGAPAGSLVLKKAGVALLELPAAEPGHGRLRLLLGPRQLLGGS
jgi:phosphohistidine phosphatase